MQRAQTLMCCTKSCYCVVKQSKIWDYTRNKHTIFILIFVNANTSVQYKVTIPTPNIMIDEFPQSFKHEQLQQCSVVIFYN